jgi:hypothetical protein
MSLRTVTGRTHGPHDTVPPPHPRTVGAVRPIRAEA